jgi:hypothetical protein
MHIVETPVYDFTELSAAAKDKARAWFRETIDDDWWDSVYDDFERICPILGVTLATTPVRLMGGGTRQKPCIWFSGFSSQGDGACFEGRYAYARARRAASATTRPRTRSCTASPTRCRRCRSRISTSSRPRSGRPAPIRTPMR